MGKTTHRGRIGWEIQPKRRRPCVSYGVVMTTTNRSRIDTEQFLEEGAAFAALAGRVPRSDADESFDVIVIGGGQSGLSVGYHLARAGLRFVILDAAERVGDAWRKRWDSLRLFTPARYDGLAGMPFPAPPNTFPTKDEFADYLESYAARFELPVRSGVRVERVTRRDDGRYRVVAGGRELDAAQVVVAMANYQQPKLPGFADQLDADIVQLHSGQYRDPSQLRDGPVLIVGAGNSGAEIARELSATHQVMVSGRSTGNLPFRIGGFLGRVLLARLLLRVIFHRVLTVKTRLGRKVYPKVTTGGGPLIRTRAKELAVAGVEWVGRTAGVRDGLPCLENGRALDVANVVWCTGFRPGFSWIELPIFDDDGKPRHHAGVVDGEPGFYFVGLHFLFSLSSGMIHGMSRDAARIAATIAARAHTMAPAAEERAANV